jgi:hypothetical protein
MEREELSDLLTDAVEIAESRLQAGEAMGPVMITDRWGDRRAEQFDVAALSDAKTRLREFVHTAAGDEQCVLVYLGRVGEGEEAILIERAKAGDEEAEVFVQRFRPRRGRFRAFKLIGELKAVGTTESVS